MDTNWEEKYPLVSVHVLERIEALSDHCPLLLTAGAHSTHRKNNSNLNMDGFYVRVSMIW
jgi:hypothetical protein